MIAGSSASRVEPWRETFLPVWMPNASAITITTTPALSMILLCTYQKESNCNTLHRAEHHEPKSQIGDQFKKESYPKDSSNGKSPLGAYLSPLFFAPKVSSCHICVRSNDGFYTITLSPTHFYNIHSFHVALFPLFPCYFVACIPFSGVLYRRWSPLTPRC